MSMSAVYEVAFRGVSFRAILCRGEPNRCAFVSSVLRTCSPDSQTNIYYCQHKINNVRKFNQTTHVAKIRFAHLNEHEIKISSGLSLIAAIHHTRTSSVMYTGPPAAFLGLFSKNPQSIHWRHRRYLQQAIPLVASSANSGLLQECVDVALPWWRLPCFLRG